ncbi:TIGR03621 family F420-dependent LLM class oxidoreductase [Streptomyces sp. NPDC050504]|uniref:TIGR03621 family F420-dependent LLM class oxidoreductase n=1 Tax=Streptomyces sp. NPDC050504 TaxID=3365618 RepID=UPI0037BA35E0
MSRPFRFGVNLMTPAGGAQWREKCRRAEALGYDVILVPDHLGMPAPFPALVAAAEATERPRLGTFVLNAAFWNPHLLAREAAGTDALTDGRFELGLGTGYVREEHERSGIAFRSAGGRVDRLRHTVEEWDRLTRDEGHVPAAVQRPRPPLLIGGNGDRVLRIAAEHARTMAFTGGREDRNGALVAHTAEELAERVETFRKLAEGRPEPVELNLLLQFAEVTDDRRARVRELAALAPHLAEEQVAALPMLALGSAGDVADQLRERRERYGFTYFAVLEHSMESFAPAIAELSGE